MFKEILNIIFSISFFSGMIIYTQYHMITYWKKEFYHIPLFTILLKFIFIIFFYVYSSQGTLHDANVYYFRPIDFFHFALGNHTLFNLGYTLREYFHLTYFNANLLLSLFPIIGMFLLLKCASEIYRGKNETNNYHYLYILFFFPSFHFWSLGFAKETFVIFSVSLFCYKVYQGKIINYQTIFLILIPIFFIRPHYVIFISAAIFIFNFLLSKNKKKDLLIFAPFILIGTYLFITSMELSPGSKLISVDDVKKFIDVRQNENISQTVNFDMSNYNYLQLTLRFIYYPNLFNIFEIENLPIQFVLIFENSILLILTCFFVIEIFKTKNIIKKKSLFTLFFLIIIFSLSASVVTSNFGIILRYKNFLYPIFMTMFFLISKKETSLKFNKN